MAQTKSKQLNYRPFTGLIIRETSTLDSMKGKRQEPLGLPEQKMREVMTICAKRMSFKAQKLLNANLLTSSVVTELCVMDI